MSPEKVDIMLRSYQECAGRCGHLEQEIAGLKSMIERLKKTALEDAVSTTSQVTGMPRGGSTSDPTARVGIMYADGGVPKEVRELEGELKALEAEYSEKHQTIVFVTAWLSGLTAKERWLIEKHVIDAAYWREVVIAYHVEFGENYSRDGLKRIQQAALQKIYKMAA
ncbi:hypothetical protein LJC33_00295 [Eubacteriales bacterium OttesenSCG-928-N13]|nr:hypothetical protein [Eubacteriales bacterium OttesenSCG-928-N13]